MQAFIYERARDLSAACAAVAARPDARFIAGGTNLIDLMKLGIERPGHLVDLTRLGLDRIEDDGAGGLRIGALVTNSELAADPRIRRRYPLLAQAILAGASAQIRNKATTAGNLLQRTRCPYFYDVRMPCNKRTSGAGCAAIGGLNRHAAILGASAACIATHPSDMAVAMVALDAVVVTSDQTGGQQRIPVAGLHRASPADPASETVLAHGELITAVEPPPPPPGRQIYRKVRDRTSYAFALVAVAAIVERQADRIRSARLALGGVAPRPWRVAAAEAALDGAPPNGASFAAAARLALFGAAGQGHNDFKIVLAERTARQALADAAGS